jgi:hypothetical protein
MNNIENYLVTKEQIEEVIFQFQQNAAMAGITIKEIQLVGVEDFTFVGPTGEIEIKMA